MERFYQDAYFWKIIHHLVFKERMIAFQVKFNEKEIWLEKEGKTEEMVVRIVRHDFDWSNYVSRDVNRLAIEGEKVRKQLRKKRLTILNLYISNYLPVDQYENVFGETYITKNKRVKIQNFIIDKEHRSLYGALKLSEVLQIKLPEFNTNTIDETDEINRYRHEVVSTSEKRLNKEKALFMYGKPFFTYILLINIGVIFGLMEYYGNSDSLLTLVEFGAKYDPLIVEGEWWRFFSAIFLHIGFLHLLMNSVALFYIGSAVERIYGTSRFIIIFFVAGFFGSVSSFAFNSQVSAGASGAIFGCFGALLYFGLNYKKLFMRTMGSNIIVVLLINLTLGFIVPMIDNSAHIGGLIGGFLASAFLHLPKHKFRIKQYLSFGLTVVACAILLIYGYGTSQETKTTQLVNVQIAQELLELGEIERAYPLLKKAVNSDMDIIEANFLLAYSEARLGLLKDAEKNLLITIDQRPFLHEAHYNLSLVYYELRQYLDAFHSVQSAIELEPNNEDYQQLKNTIETHLKKVNTF